MYFINKKYNYLAEHFGGKTNEYNIANKLLGFNFHHALSVICFQTIKEGANLTRPKRLEDFSYDDAEMASVFQEEIANINFWGMTVM